MSEQELETLKVQLRSVPQGEILRQYFRGEQIGRSSSHLTQNAVFVTIRRCWSPVPPFNMTEVGLAIYNGKRRQETAGPHGENVLNDVRFLHLRVRKHASLRLREGLGAEPEKFHFGTTVYVNQDEAHSLLSQIWHQPMDETNPAAGFRPVICLMAANDKPLIPFPDTNIDLDVSPAEFHTTVAIIDPDLVASQNHFASFPYVPPVDQILGHHFGITTYHPENTGNQAAYMAIMAVLISIHWEIYYHPILNIHGFPGPYGQSGSKTAQEVLQYLMDYETPPPPFGSIVYCTKCASSRHLSMDCPEPVVVCSKCRNAVDSWRVSDASSHTDKACSYGS